MADADLNADPTREPHSPTNGKRGVALYWSERYHRSVTDAEVDEINRNLLAYFALLRQWDNDERARKDAGANK